MKALRLALTLMVLCLLPLVALAQSGSSQDVGSSTFFNFGALSGSSQSFGNTTFYNFSDGSSTTRTDDPVRMYLREMGSVELLSREGEIAIAKRIEAGREAMIAGLCESPLTFQDRKSIPRTEAIFPPPSSFLSNSTTVTSPSPITS